MSHLPPQVCLQLQLLKQPNTVSDTRPNPGHSPWSLSSSPTFNPDLRVLKACLETTNPKRDPQALALS